jgi:transmembrane sensor
MSKTNDASSAIEAQARAWLVRLRSGKVTVAELDAFKRWCAEDPEHERTVRALRDVWTTLRSAASEFAVEKPAARSWPRRTSTARAFSPGRRAWVGFAVAAGASWLALRPPLNLWPALGDLAADYWTGTGDQRRVVLSDRLTVEMNTQTRINLMSARDGGANGGHRINLLTGEVEVVAGAQAAGLVPVRTVAVVAGRGVMRASIARFNVRRIDDQVCVACESGMVALEHPVRRVALVARQQIVYDDREVRSVEAVDSRAVTAWRRGLLEFNGAPLARVIDEINRYRPGKLILKRTDLSESQVQLRFPIARLNDGIDILCRLYGLHMTKLPGGIVLLG